MNVIMQCLHRFKYGQIGIWIFYMCDDFEFGGIVKVASLVVAIVAINRNFKT